MNEDKTLGSGTEKSEADLLRERLLRQTRHACEVMNPAEIAAADAFCEGYKTFLNQAKTEREAAAFLLARARALGFREFRPGDICRPGDKCYVNNRNKALILAVAGKEPAEAGLRLTAAHIDSPRLDLKPSPLYEDKALILGKTHYYGGIKKYQWAAIPLALHGVVVKKDGTIVPVSIGEDPADPKFCVTDLLPHLAAEQMKRTLDKGIQGEELNIIFGSRPILLDGKPEGFKLNILQILHERYGITEWDLLSAELEAVPAFPACDVGLDRGMIGAYGQDDRVCAYPCAEALFALEGVPDRTAVAVLADKEEIGSCGNTGLDTNFLLDFITDLVLGQGGNPRVALRNTKCLSADVNAAFDPTFPGVMEPQNAAYCNLGVVVTKYTGARGKSGTSDAGAEFFAWVRNLLDEAGVLWQAGELGKVDEGGGGTVAVDLAKLNLDVIDIGVPILSMHAPFELAAKLDIAMLEKACRAFYQS
ncbi:MAG: aminopeptidase [Oscillospiraceae bacterium]|jgi:aspartyl aminopeptidase|nr:aminopeptidase [Oscillospiraceae bacterium]